MPKIKKKTKSSNVLKFSVTETLMEDVGLFVAMSFIFFVRKA